MTFKEHLIADAKKEVAAVEAKMKTHKDREYYGFELLCAQIALQKLEES